MGSSPEIERKIVGRAFRRAIPLRQGLGTRAGAHWPYLLETDPKDGQF
jgi:hypothetical protein